jgi:hypothetical protein
MGAWCHLFYIAAASRFDQRCQPRRGGAQSSYAPEQQGSKRVSHAESMIAINEPVR